MFLADPLLAGYFQTRALLLALRAGEPFRVARSLTSEAIFRGLRGASRQQVEPLLSRARLLAGRLNDRYLLARIYLARGLLEFLHERWERAMALLRHAEEILRSHREDVSFDLAVTQSIFMRCLFWRGDWQRLAELLPSVLDEAHFSGNRHAESHYRVCYCWLLLALDRPEQVGPELDRAKRLDPEEGYRYDRSLGVRALVETALYLGQAEEALRRVEQGGGYLQTPRLSSIRPADDHVAWLRARAALAALGAAAPADRTRLDRLVTRSIQSMSRRRALGVQGRALLVRAGAAACRGRLKQAEALIRSAEAAFAGSGMKVLEAVCVRRRGQLAGGPEGDSLVRWADRVLVEQGARNPARLSDMFAPGWWRHRSR
jgi:tetratricopeptide (TPR) repeat protein